jgi:16S rRNA (guanine(966)-N(2))-methyltransferase RsmD
MRVIGGVYRSRKLRTLRGLALRPSSDRLRETLFNVLGPDIADAVFVDLFAGSGAIGIEALSRGARRAIFVENHRAAAALLRSNLESLGIPLGRPENAPNQTFSGAAEIFAQDACRAIERLAARGTKADLVFADPPYADVAAYKDVVELLGESTLLAPGSRLILEHEGRREMPMIAGQLERVRVLEQGSAALSFYHVVRAAQLFVNPKTAS